MRRKKTISVHAIMKDVDLALDLHRKRGTKSATVFIALGLMIQCMHKIVQGKEVKLQWRIAKQKFC